MSAILLASTGAALLGLAYVLKRHHKPNKPVKQRFVGDLSRYYL